MLVTLGGVPAEADVSVIVSVHRATSRLSPVAETARLGRNLRAVYSVSDHLTGLHRAIGPVGLCLSSNNKFSNEY